MNITDGSKLAPGQLHLKSGMANIRFKSGALVMLEAPARFEIESTMRSRLLSGKALVEAPESAHGFIVTTPHGYITDHGTRFSIAVSAAEATCEVLEGEISLHHPGTGKVQHLLDQQASILSSQGISELDLLPSTVVRPPAAQSIRLGTNGKETSIVRSNLREKLLHPGMLMVKNSFSWSLGEPGNADRRAFFSIPLNGLKPSDIGTAKLRLNLIPSGLGFAAYLPETVRFAVYGITDESRENWATEGLAWEDAPGYLSPASDQLNSEEVTKLGTFELSRGQLRGSVLFQSEAMNDFLRNDTTNAVSFIIVRESTGIKNLSLVHAFASNQHPEASGAYSGDFSEVADGSASFVSVLIRCPAGS